MIGHSDFVADINYSGILLIQSDRLLSDRTSDMFMLEQMAVAASRNYEVHPVFRRACLRQRSRSSTARSHTWHPQRVRTPCKDVRVFEYGFCTYDILKGLQERAHSATQCVHNVGRNQEMSRA